MPDDAEARHREERNVFEKGRDDKHGDALERGGALERPEESGPGHLGHAKVEQNKIGEDRAHERQSIAAVPRRQDLISPVRECVGPELADTRVVVNDKNPRPTGGHHPLSIAAAALGIGRNFAGGKAESAVGSAWEREPWTTVQRAAWESLQRREAAMV
jgi:hypothetical protein